MAFFAHAAEDSSRLQIQIPQTLMQDGGYSHKQALFGKPSYGGSIALQVLYTNSTMCADSDVAVNKWMMPSPDAAETPFILMMDRGDCTFVSKVRRAQHAGAAAVLVSDHKCLCGEAKCVSEQPCESVEPIMADDGSGADIAIPAYLLKKVDSDLIKGIITQGTLVVAEMSWALPNPDDRVEWTLWTSSLDEGAELLKADFLEITKGLGRRAYFVPHYMIFDGVSLRCTDSDDHCGNLCTNEGRYCLPDPDNDRSNGLSGADLVAESLRQLCIWNIYGSQDAEESNRGVGLPWWEYTVHHATDCSPDHFADTACIEAAMHAAGVDKGKVEKCMLESGGTEKGVNDLLAAEVSEKDRHTIVITPSVYVNNIAERGAMTAPQVMSTICAGYAAGTEPGICQCTGMSREDLLACVSRDGAKEPSSTGGISPGAVVGIILAVVAAMTLAGFVYWKRTQSQMRDQVRGILAEYMPLEDLGDGRVRPAGDVQLTSTQIDGV
eukprot:CAMPEP_0113939512 /NCGR_PEP_ID=MMETSP1339-20121228/5811_1 /TAXON_ID=94617 /ORGANISM="Fibrocapsa japonica" /LENGTH=494 /DNA_ID=CAMNT_0000943029 /DNA_START=70 /DNA_END=1554 /DNA_ORIENTATION=- /assembly_acc=CAM_ASM_000762